jgi:kynurenine formamidase
MADDDRRWKVRPEGSNWGDFGDDDHIGRMNLITPGRRRAALAEAREGLCFSLSLPLDYPGGTTLSHGTRQPPKLFSPYYNRDADEIPGCHDVSCDDGVVIYSQYSTQWDSLAHWGQRFDADADGIAEKVYYNGYRGGEHVVDEDSGGPCARALGMEHLAVAGAQGRGVLVDLSEEQGRVGYDALMRAIDGQGVQVTAGDLFCFHTGADTLLLSMNRQPDAERIARVPTLDGRDERLLRWIDESGIAAICSDNTGIEEIRFSPPPGASKSFSVFPLHELCLFKLGIHLGELWHLAELKAWLHAHGRSAFLLTAPPWRLPGSVGSPVNPIATV